MTDHQLATLLERAALANCSRIAFRGERFSLTYGQLLERARTVSDVIRMRGISTDDTVMAKVSNHPLDFVAFLGIWLAGGVVVPAHRTSPSGVVDAIQVKAQCKVCVDLLLSDDLPPCVTPLSSTGIGDERRLMLKDGAFVIFTSGSTGLPKGAVLTHQAFAGKLEQNQRLLNVTSDDVTLLVLNNTFSFGIWLALLTLQHAGTVVTRSKFNPLMFLQALVKERITRVGVVPTMIRATFGSLTSDEVEGFSQEIRTTGSLKDVVIGGEPLGSELSAMLRSFIAPAGLYDIYGLTETSTSDFILQPQDYAGHPGSIGKPAHEVSSRIIDEHNSEAPDFVSGELQLKTPFVMSGYLGDEELTRAAFVDGWFRTGDLAMRDEEGFVTIVGRLKELIVRGGNKITPLEVERALCSCSGVASALVAGAPDSIMGQRIHALLIPQAGMAIDASSLRASLDKTLEKYKHPDICYIGSELPTGRTGKIDRGQLKSLITAGEISQLTGWSN